jgi:hypothetical protein
MQIKLIQFLAIRWSILITFGSYLSPPQPVGNNGVVNTLVSEETENGFADV